jgi:uroporphyrinogen decarboxylase
MTKIRADFITESDDEGGEYELDGSGRRIGYRPATGYYFESIYNPLSGANSLADCENYSWPVRSDEELERLAVEARRLYSETDYAILASFGGSFLEEGQNLRGWTNFMMDLAGNPVFAEALLDKILENHLKNVDLFLDAVGDHIQIIQMGGDLGTQNGPQMHPDLYYDMIQPRQKILWQRIHEKKPDVAVFLHCCGAIFDLIPGIVDAGCDILNPVQISAKGMEPQLLKDKFGSELCFWGGGCDTQTILPFATPDEVYEHTRKMIDIFKPDSGFVFCQVHNIQHNVPPENIVAMYDAVKDNWDY